MSGFEREASATWVREHFSELLDGIRETPVAVRRNGRSVAVIVSPEFYGRAVEALEDAADGASLEEWQDSPDRATVTLAEVLQRLEGVESELHRRAG